MRYSLTSANDAPIRDPRDFVVQGSNDGSTWTDLDKRAGETFSGRFATNTYSFTNTSAYAFYRLNVTANSGDSLVQLADWNISDGSDVRPPATPMVSEATAGPNGGYTTKPDAGFTGLAALRYSGGAEGDGRSYATNKLFDVNIPVGPKTRLSYKIFPEFTGGRRPVPVHLRRRRPALHRRQLPEWALARRPARLPAHRRRPGRVEGALRRPVEPGAGRPRHRRRAARRSTASCSAYDNPQATGDDPVPGLARRHRR